MKKIFFICLLLLTAYSLPISAGEDFFHEIDQYNNLRLGNEYIVVVVNLDENGQGRFAIETTGGAPMRGNDDKKPLVYGRPKPWTSYTSLWINGDYYVFGGYTGRRAGKNGKYGEVVQPPTVKDDGIQSITKYNENLLVEQNLRIVKSSTTGLYDSVEIKYRIKNTGQKEEKVGLRIMLDTMLGENDGAPFRIGKDAVTTDKIYYKKQLPVFWQAFDSISNPNVTSQGSFTGQGVTPPDKVMLADWGSLADGVWDFDFNPGEDFLRKGEYEIDSAIAMYWVPELIQPGEEKTYITKYGLGGITIVPGIISLGVTSPAEVTFDTPDKTFPIVAYVENTSEINAKNVTVELDLPSALNTEESKIRNLGDLASGDIAQLVWHVKSAGGSLPSTAKYTVKVEADNTDSNKVEREIKFAGPPKLDASIKLLDKLKVMKGALKPNPFRIQAVVANNGGSPLYDVVAELVLPPGLSLSSREMSKRYLTNLHAGEKVRVSWLIKALDVSGKLPFAVDVRALHGYKITEVKNIELPHRGTNVYLTMHNGKDDNYLGVDITGQKLTNINNFNLTLKYDTSYLQPVFVSRGNIFLHPDNNKLLPWKKPDISQNGVIKFNENIPSQIEKGTIATVYFKVLQEGETEVKLQDGGFFDNKGQKVNVTLNNLKMSVKGGQ